MARFHPTISGAEGFAPVSLSTHSQTAAEAIEVMYPDLVPARQVT